MTTLADNLDLFIAELEQRRFRPNTRIAYCSDLKLAARHLPGPFDQISLEQIEAFLGVGDVSPATSARRAASLKRFFGWAKKQGLCAANPRDSAGIIMVGAIIRDELAGHRERSR